jgi:hypothetical protein
MSKLLSMVSAAILVLSCAGHVSAAEDSKPTNEEKPQGQDRAKEPTQQETTGDLTKQEQEYLSALKKCESMNAAEKQQCVEATRKKFGHQ